MDQSARLSIRDCVDLPGAGNTLEFVLTEVLEVDARTSDEIFDRRGQEYLSGSGESRHTRPDVHGHPGDIVVA